MSFAVTAKLISALVFATRIVQFLYFLNPKCPASNHPLCLYSSVCVGPFEKPHCWFSHDMAEMHIETGFLKNVFQKEVHIKDSVSIIARGRVLR